MKKLSLLMLLGLSLGLMTGCGGGGGGGGAMAVNPPSQNPGGGTVTRVTGELNVRINFPPLTGARGASTVPTSTATVLVAAYPVVEGRAAAVDSGSVVLSRPSSEGGEVSGQLVLSIGRYEVRVTAKNASGQVVASSTEPALIESRKVTKLPTTLGLSHTDSGFSPQQLTIRTGEPLVVRQAGRFMGNFKLEDASCEAILQKSGALACVVRSAGTYTLTSPEGHQATITVVPDEATLSASKPALGVQRSVGLLAASEDGFQATFFVNNGNETMPEGLVLDPGNGEAAIPVPAGNLFNVSYSKGTYIAQLKDGQGNVLSQRYIGVFDQQIAPPPTVEVGSQSTQVTNSHYIVTGHTQPGAVVMVSQFNIGQLKSTTADAAGLFSLEFTLVEGANTFLIASINEEGVLGGFNGQQVALTSPEPGVLTSLEITNLSGSMEAGQTITFQVIGRDGTGAVIDVNPIFTVNGLSATSQGTNAFTVYIAGSGVLHVEQEGVSAEVPISIVAGPIARLRVLPGNSNTRVGRTVTFTVQGRDAYGNITPTPEVTGWQTTGTLSGFNTATGVMTPTQSGFGSVKATAGSFQGEACISVNPALQTTT